MGKVIEAPPRQDADTDLESIPMFEDVEVCNSMDCGRIAEWTGFFDCGHGMAICTTCKAVIDASADQYGRVLVTCMGHDPGIPVKVLRWEHM